MKVQQENIVGNSQMLTPQDVARLLVVKDSWIYKNWERLGIPFKKLGHLLRISPCELEEWVKSQPPKSNQFLETNRH